MRERFKNLAARIKEKIIKNPIATTLIPLLLSAQPVAGFACGGVCIFAIVVIVFAAGAIAYQYIPSFLMEWAYATINLILGLIVRTVAIILKPIIRLAFAGIMHGLKFNPTIYPLADGNPTISALIRLILKLLVPLYEILLILIGAYIIFVSIKPQERARAKAAFNKVIISMFFASSAPIIFQTLLDIQLAITSMVLVYTAGGLADRMANGMILAFMNPWTMWYAILVVLVAVVVVFLRYLVVQIMAVIYPLAIFLYFFDFTKGYGANWLRKCHLWIAIPIAQALVLVLTATTVGEIDDYMAQGFLVSAGLVAFVGSGLMMAGLMKWVGGLLAMYGASRGDKAGISSLGALAAGQMMMGAGPSGLVSAGATLGWMMPGGLGAHRASGAFRGLITAPFRRMWSGMKGGWNSAGEALDSKKPTASGFRRGVNKVSGGLFGIIGGYTGAKGAAREVGDAVGDFTGRSRGYIPLPGDFKPGGGGGGGKDAKKPERDDLRGQAQVPRLQESGRVTRVDSEGRARGVGEGDFADTFGEVFKTRGKWMKRGGRSIAGAGADLMRGRFLSAGGKFIMGTAAIGASLMPLSPLLAFRMIGRIALGNARIHLPPVVCLPAEWLGRSLSGASIRQVTSRSIARVRLAKNARQMERAMARGDTVKAAKHRDRISGMLNQARYGSSVLGEPDINLHHKMLTWLHRRERRYGSKVLSEVKAHMNVQKGGVEGLWGGGIGDRKGESYKQMVEHYKATDLDPSSAAHKAALDDKDFKDHMAAVEKGKIDTRWFDDQRAAADAAGDTQLATFYGRFIGRNADSTAWLDSSEKDYFHKQAWLTAMGVGVTWDDKVTYDSMAAGAHWRIAGGGLDSTARNAFWDEYGLGGVRHTARHFVELNPDEIPAALHNELLQDMQKRAILIERGQDGKYHVDQETYAYIKRRMADEGGDIRIRRLDRHIQRDERGEYVKDEYGRVLLNEDLGTNRLTNRKAMTLAAAEALIGEGRYYVYGAGIARESVSDADVATALAAARARTGDTWASYDAITDADFAGTDALIRRNDLRDAREKGMYLHRDDADSAVQTGGIDGRAVNRTAEAYMRSRDALETDMMARLVITSDELAPMRLNALRFEYREDDPNVLSVDTSDNTVVFNLGAATEHREVSGAVVGFEGFDRALEQGTAETRFDQRTTSEQGDIIKDFMNRTELSQYAQALGKSESELTDGEIRHMARRAYNLQNADAGEQNADAGELDKIFERELSHEYHHAVLTKGTNANVRTMSDTQKVLSGTGTRGWFKRAVYGEEGTPIAAPLFRSRKYIEDAQAGHVAYNDLDKGLAAADQHLDSSMGAEIGKNETGAYILDLHRDGGNVATHWDEQARGKVVGTYEDLKGKGRLNSDDLAHLASMKAYAERLTGADPEVAATISRMDILARDQGGWFGRRKYDTYHSGYKAMWDNISAK